MSISNDFLQEQIDSTKAQILAYQGAVTAIATGGAQSYTLDTGQSRQTVTKLDLLDLQKTLAALYNQLSTLCARMNGASTLVVPAW